MNTVNDRDTMRKKQRTLLFALISTALLTASLILVLKTAVRSDESLGKSELGGEQSGLRIPGYQFLKGQSLTYSLDYSSCVEVNQNLFSKKMKLANETVAVGLNGELKQTVLEISDKTVTALVQFTGRFTLGENQKALVLETGTHELRDFTQGWTLTLDLEGRVKSIATLAEKGTLAHGVMLHLSSLLQCSVPRNASDTWERREETSLGVSQTQYHAVPRGDLIEIRRERRFSTLHAAEMDLAVPQDVIFQFSGALGRVQSVMGCEEVVGDYEGQRCYRGLSSVKLIFKARGFFREETLPKLEAVAASLAERHSGSLFSKVENGGKTADLAAIKGLDIKTVLEATTRVGQQSVKENVGILRQLAAFVRVDPKNAKLVADALCKTQPGQEQEDLLLAALGAAGSPQAAEVLRRFMADRQDYPESLRAALPSLGQMEKPDEDTTRFLQDLYGSGRQPAEIRGMALLALGALAEKAQDDQGSLGQRLTKFIEDEMMDKTADKRIVLLALGNGGHVDSLPVIERELADDRPLEIRATALDSLRKIKSERADLLLTEALSSSQTDLRFAAASVYSSRPLTAQSRTVLEGLAQNDSSKDLRMAALRAISNGMKTEPQSYTVFERAAQFDPDQEVRAYAKGFLLFVQK